MKSCGAKQALRKLPCKIPAVSSADSTSCTTPQECRRTQACSHQGHARFEALAAKTNK